jgi:hypothetical protein
MSVSRDVPLREIDEWPKDLVEKLDQIWITTAEQVVATSATPDGLQALANHLGVPVKDTIPLIKAARSRLSPELAKELESPVDTSEYGLGVIRPPDDQSEHSQ